MLRSAVRTIGKYLRIYRILMRFALIRATQYRVSFLIELLVEFGHQIVLIFFFQVVYANVKGIAGWTYYEVLFFTGLNIVASEFLLSAFYIFNLKQLPRKIKNGELDQSLLLPINPLFNQSVSMPYYTGFVAMLSGIFLMIYSLFHLSVSFNPIAVVVALVMVLFGFVIAYSIFVIFSSLTFYFLNAQSLVSIGQHVVTEFKANPPSVYVGWLRILFMYIIPVVFIAGVPASTILHAIDFRMLWIAALLAAIFFTAALLLWNRMIKFYASAT